MTARFVLCAVVCGALGASCGLDGDAELDLRVAPGVGGALEVDPAGALLGAAADQTSPAVAYSGQANREYLVVWQDLRRGTGKHDIYGAHVSSDGVTIEQGGFIISDPQDGKDHTKPALAYDPVTQLYLVVFLEDNSIVARAVTAVGTAAVGADLPIAGPATFSNVGVAWDSYTGGAHPFGIVWQMDKGGVSEIHVVTATLTATATTASLTGVLTATIGSAGASNPNIANAGDFTGPHKFLVVYEYQHGIWGTAIDEHFGLSAAFAVLPPGGLFDNFASPRAAFVGSANPHDPTRWWVVFAISHGPPPSAPPLSVAWVNVNFPTTDRITSWFELGEAPTAVAGVGRVPDTSTTEHVMVLLEYARTTETLLDAATARVDYNTPHLLTEELVDADVRSPYDRNVAFASGETTGSSLLVWDSVPTLDRGDNIAGLRIGADGTRRDPQDLTISTGFSDQMSPAMAYCGNRYLVAVHDKPSAITGFLYDASGVQVASEISIAQAIVETDAHVAIGCNGRSFTVTWSDRDGTFNLHATTVTSAGAVGAASPPIATAETHLSSAVASSSSTGTWIAYDKRVGTDSYIYAQKLDGASHAVGAPVVVNHSLARTGVVANPDIAMGVSGLYVVYQQGDHLYANALSTAGAVGAKLAVETAPVPQRNPRIAWVGSNFVIAYEDDRTVATRGSDIYGRSLSSAGVVGSAFLVSSTVGDDVQPRVITRGTGTTAEILFVRRGTSAPFSGDLYGQTIVNSLPSGTSYGISTSSTSHDTLPAGACATATSCLTVYLAFDFATANAYRAMTRVLAYP